MSDKNIERRFNFQAVVLIALIIVIIAVIFAAGCASSSKTTREATVNPPPPTKATPTPQPTPIAPPEEVTPKEPTKEETVSGEEASKPPQTEPMVNIGSVYFEFDKYDLGSDARSTLATNAQWLKSHPDIKIRVEGNCDERGTVEYNLALGEKRANAVKDYYVSLGIPAGRIQTVSYGKERPLDPGHNEEAWAKNRRSDTVKIVP